MAQYHRASLMWPQDSYPASRLVAFPSQLPLQGSGSYKGSPGACATVNVQIPTLSLSAPFWSERLAWQGFVIPESLAKSLHHPFKTTLNHQHHERTLITEQSLLPFLSFRQHFKLRILTSISHVQIQALLESLCLKLSIQVEISQCCQG